MKKKLAILCLLLCQILLLGCNDKKQNPYPVANFDFVVPGGMGGGWDQTMHAVAKVLKETKLIKEEIKVRNAPGDGGAAHLESLQTSKNNDYILSVYSPPLLLIHLNGTSAYGYKDLTPLARLTADYGAFVVQKGSKYSSLKDVMDALKRDPKSVRIGGTSTLGSMDHIQFLMVAKAAGVQNLKDIEYKAFDDGGAGFLGTQIDLLSTSLGDVGTLVESGDLVVLAQTGPKRVNGPVKGQIPTCIEEGVDVTFINWRGLFGTAKMSKNAVTFWDNTLGKMVKTPQWHELRRKNGWIDAYLDGADFEKFLDKTQKKYEQILKEIGVIKPMK